MIDRAVHEKVHAFGAENRLTLGWALEEIRSRLLRHTDPDVQAYVREQLRKALN
jgi:hypothetical protein